MNKLTDFIITKKTNTVMNKSTVTGFIYTYKDQFINGDFDINCLHIFHILMWNYIDEYYNSNYIFKNIHISKVKNKMKKRLMKDIKKQISLLLNGSEKVRAINNIKSLFNLLEYHYNCFACYYSSSKSFYFEPMLRNECINCPVKSWRLTTCLEYTELCDLTKNKKDFKINRSNIITLCKKIKNIEWSIQ